MESHTTANVTAHEDSCFGCGQVGHMKRECPKKANGGSHEDSVFAVWEDRSAGWLIDSGAMAHMTPHRDDL
ncbi:polyprotein [Phytophthora megakarya]|uniref:Polyprotein n=1 Tax=Phytophthora megakarya TaxID=4795 RepID=A0A225WG07_9STRA|nr:polyprotein [Phytophthora megakarya]